MENLGDSLRQLRKEKGWAQEDLARHIGVCLSTVQVTAMNIRILVDDHQVVLEGLRLLLRQRLRVSRCFCKRL